MDLQTHHVVPSAEWYTENTGEAAFFLVAWSQANCGELDRNECLGRFHYLKELMLDSATDVTILSAVPWKPDGQPLPLSESINTAEIVRTLAGGTRRTYCHKFVLPNRGSLGDNSDQLLTAAGQDPVFFQEEMDLMTAAAAQYAQNDGYLRAWKIYTPWGDVPNTSGWWLDNSFGLKFIQHVKDLSDAYGMPALVCAHKGFALPSFDQEKAATRDVGVVAPMFWDLTTGTGVTFIIYHSGYDGDSVGLGGPLNQGTSANGPYPGEAAAPSTSRGVDDFITALRENGWSARHFAPGGSPGTPLAGGEAPADAAHANVPNVYAELGSVWGSVVGNPTRGSWLLGKLIYYIGPKRVVWGTDALWGGSPQGLIEALRAFQMSDEARATYNLPWGLDGDDDDETGSGGDPADRSHHRHGGLPHPSGVEAEQPVRDGAAEESAPRSGEHRIARELHHRLPAALLGSAGDGAAPRARARGIRSHHGVPPRKDRPAAVALHRRRGRVRRARAGSHAALPGRARPRHRGYRSHDPLVGAGGAGHGRHQSLHRRVPAGRPRPLRSVAGRNGPQDLRPCRRVDRPVREHRSAERRQRSPQQPPRVERRLRVLQPLRQPSRHLLDPGRRLPGDGAAT